MRQAANLRDYCYSATAGARAWAVSQSARSGQGTGPVRHPVAATPASCLASIAMVVRAQKFYLREEIMRPDEKQFLMDVFKNVRCYYPEHTQEGCTPRDLINKPDFPIHPKRAIYLLHKWCSKSWYEYGVTLDLGWLTSEGIRKVEELLKV